MMKKLLAGKRQSIRVFTMLIALTMLIGLVPIQAYAEGGAVLSSVSLSLDTASTGRLALYTSAETIVTARDSAGNELPLDGAAITYSVTPESVALVDSKGTVTALSLGQATLSAKVKLNGAEATGTFQINVAVSGENLLAGKNHDFEGEITAENWPWDWGYEAPESLDGVFLYSQVATRKRGDDENNKAFVFKFNPEHAPTANPLAVMFKSSGSSRRIRVKSGRLYEMTFYTKINVNFPSSNPISYFFDYYAYPTPTVTSSTAVATGRNLNLRYDPGFPETYSEWTKVTIPVAAHTLFDGDSYGYNSDLFITPRLTIRQVPASGPAGFSGEVLFDDFEIREVGYAGVEATLNRPISENVTTATLKVMPYTTTGNVISYFRAEVPNNLTVTSSDESVLTVGAISTKYNSLGENWGEYLITLANPGKADITASSIVNNETKSTVIPINTNVVKLNDVEISVNRTELLVGDTTTASVTGTMSDGSIAPINEAQVSYSSSNQSVIEIDANTGDIQAKALGNADIMVSVTLDGETVTDTVAMSVIKLVARDMYYNLFKLCLRRAYGWSTSEAIANANKGTDITTVTSFAHTTKTDPPSPEEINPDTIATGFTDPWHFISFSGNASPRFMFVSYTYGLMLRDQGGDYMGTRAALKIRVPADGLYQAVSVNSYMASGAMVRVYLAPDGAANPMDDMYSLGSIDTYLNGSSYNIPTGLRTLQLDAGDYILSYEMIGANSQASGTPTFFLSGLKLNVASQMPTLSVSANSLEPLPATVTASTDLAASWSDGAAEDMLGMTILAVPRDAAVASAIATTSENKMIKSIAVTGLKKGSTVIDVSVTRGGETLATCEIPVTITGSEAMLSDVNLSFSDTNITPGKTVQASVTGTLGDGSEVDLSEAEVVFESSRPTVVIIDRATGAISADSSVACGEAAITATVTYRNVTIADTKTITLNGGTELSGVLHEYDLKIGKNAYPDSDIRPMTYEDTGGVWAFAGLNPAWTVGMDPAQTKMLRNNQSYGVQMQTSANGMWVSVKFNISKAGRYILSLEHLKGPAGGIGEMYFAPSSVEDSSLWSSPQYYAGSVDFYKPNPTQIGVTGIGEVIIPSAGEYILTFLPNGRTQGASSVNMYPGIIILNGTVFMNRLDMSAGKQELNIGETTAVALSGGMSDGSQVDFGQVDAVYSTSDSRVAEVDENGNITALAEGFATITVNATLGDTRRTASVDISVIDPSPITAATLTSASEIEQGRTAQLNVSAVMGSGLEAYLPNASITYSVVSANPAGSVTVSGDGVVSANTVGGVARIKATVSMRGNSVDTNEITVSVIEREMLNVTLGIEGSETGRVAVDSKRALLLSLTDDNDKPIDISTAEVDFSVSPASAAEIDEDYNLITKEIRGADINVTVTANNTTKSITVPIDIRESGENLMSDRNGDFENDYWPWSLPRKDQPLGAPEFMRLTIGTIPRDGNPNNRAMGVVFNPEVAALTNPAPITLNATGDRVRIQAGKFYEHSFKIKIDYKKPADANYMAHYMDFYGYRSATSSGTAGNTSRNVNIAATPGYPGIYSEWTQVRIPISAPLINTADPNNEYIYITPRIVFRPNSVDLQRLGYDGVVWLDDIEIREVGFSGVTTELLGNKSNIGDMSELHLKPYASTGTPISVYSANAAGSTTATSSDDYIVRPSSAVSIKGNAYDGGYWIMSTLTANGKNGTADITADVTLNGITRRVVYPFTVQGMPIILQEISLSADSVDLSVGDTASLNLSGIMTDDTSADLSAADVKYYSSNSRVLTVSGDGTVSAIGEGEAKVVATATMKGRTCSAELVINVTDNTGLTTVTILGNGNVGEARSEKLELRGVMESGLNAPLDKADITFRLENVAPAGAVSVSADGVIMGNTLGGSADIYATATLRGVTVTSEKYSVTVVAAIPEAFTFDFRSVTAGAPLDAAISAEGWEINRAQTASGVQSGSSVLSYGMSGITAKIRKSGNTRDSELAIDVNIPYSGYYTFEISGGKSLNGGLSSIYVDELYAGEYDFYGIKDASFGDIARMRTFFLDAGVHTVTLRTIGTTGGGFEQYPGDITFRGVREMPTLAGVNITADRSVVAFGETASVFAQVIMSDGVSYKICAKKDGTSEQGIAIVFASSDESVFTVNPDGKVNPMAVGTAKVSATATVGGLQAVRDIPITVNDRVLARVTFESVLDNLFIGDTARLSVRGVFDDESDISMDSLKVTYSVDNASVISIAGNEITAASEGGATITATVTLGDITKTATMDVTVLPEGLEYIVIDAENRYMKPDSEGVQLTVSGRTNTGTIYNLSGAAITFESRDTGIINVSSTGFVTPVSLGSANVTATVTVDDRVLTEEINMVVTAGKVEPTYYTKEKVEIARENIVKYKWARSMKDAAVKKANRYLEREDQLWSMVPGEGLPRASGIGFVSDPEAGICRYCKVNVINTYGGYSWLTRPLTDPWKVQCPDCRRRFPSNDFASYYQSGLNENGVFERRIAEENGQEYLKNVLYPEMDDGWGVDDGWGYKPGRTYSNGVEESWTYIAYYIHYGLWYPRSGRASGEILSALQALGDAYIYTGDMKYGRAGAILIDRIADLYPDYSLMQYNGTFSNSHGGSGEGKTIGRIWEAQNIAPALALAYDAFYPAMDDPFVVNFLNNKASVYKLGDKSTPEAIRENCENGILRGIFEGCKTADVYGNFGMHQKSIAYAAVVLDTMPDSKEMIDWMFRKGTYTKSKNTGGDVLARLVDNVTRDGQGNESAAGYNYIWLNDLLDAAEALNGYSTYSAGDLYKNPKFVRMFTSFQSLTTVQKGKPSIGDSGGVASYGHRLDMDTMKLGFMRTGIPELAQTCYWLNGNKTDGIRADIFTENPENLRDEIQKVIDEHGTRDWTKSEMLTGYGFAILRSGDWYKSVGIDATKDTQRDFWIYFGGADTSHRHRDSMNLGIEAYGINFAPDLGYPEATGNNPNRVQWVSNTISHNTVVVNEEPQIRQIYAGFPLHFDASDRVRVMDADYPSSYPGVTSIYRRTVVMVEVDDEVSYGVDFFRIRGGDDHMFSFHSQSDEIYKTENLDLIPQVGGTYAGPNVMYGPNSDYLNGYTWFRNIRRADNPDNGEFAVDFKVKDFRKVLPETLNLHLRMTMLNDWKLSEVTIAEAEGPSTNKNIPPLEYVLARRKGKNLDTLYTTVFEPYKDNRYIKSMSSVSVEPAAGTPGIIDEAKAVKIEHVNGRIDYVVYSTNNSVKYLVDGLFEFRGFVGVCSYADGREIYAYVNDGDMVGESTTGISAYGGTLEDFSKDLVFDNELTVRFDSTFDEDNIKGRFIYVENDGVQNAVYEILGVDKLSDTRAVIHIGNNTTIRKFINPEDIYGGYIYDIAKGQRIRIPLSTENTNAPIIKQLEKRYVDADSQIRIKIDAHSPLDRELTLSAPVLPRGASFYPESGIIDWRPERNQVGDHHVAIEANDGDLSTTMHFYIGVLGSTASRNDDSKPGTTPGGTPGAGETPTPAVPGGSEPGSQPIFNDLAGYDWAEDAINELATDGIIKGMGDRRYSPGSNITRADYAILLVRAFKMTSDSKDNFADVSSSDYFADELAVAKANGIVTGVGENMFKPRETINRQDMMLIVARALAATGFELNAASDDALNEFSDAAELSDYARDATALLVSNGIIAGSHGKLNPKGKTTRAEIAVLLSRILNKK